MGGCVSRDCRCQARVLDVLYEPYSSRCRTFAPVTIGYRIIITASSRLKRLGLCRHMTSKAQILNIRCRKGIASTAHPPHVPRLAALRGPNGSNHMHCYEYLLPSTLTGFFAFSAVGFKQSLQYEHCQSAQAPIHADIDPALSRESIYCLPHSPDSR